MSESENSETEEREKYKVNQKNAETWESVKSILSKEKHPEKQQKTANIEIRKGPNNNNHSLPKRKSGCEEVVNENHSDNSSESAEYTVKAEFKNDLMFDLDM